jgi:hypothetical protein
MYENFLFAQTNRVGGALQGAVIGGAVGACVVLVMVFFRAIRGSKAPKPDDTNNDQGDSP